ncbi:MAG: phenyltransferase domain-containing protein [Deltaproteobacteria bacterium]|nr:phenyltransferase domain-containing protein [Deltaproteobacteria bacterium]
MKQKLSEKPIFEAIDLSAMAGAICRLQKPDGEIPWSAGGKTDPWDHVESAMALSVAGYLEEARKAFLWVASRQMEDGGLYASYKNGEPLERRKDPNMSSYLAVGVWHHYLVCEDASFLNRMWPAVCAALDFCVGLQGEDGGIFWSVAEDGTVEERALLTGSSSIYLALKCGLAIAARLHKTRPRWEFAKRRLGEAIRNRPGCFDQSKDRYSMDWYYPILCGAVEGEAAHARLDAFWDKFVVENWGVRCVSDRPWVTMAESAELVLALCAAGRHGQAGELFSWIKNSRFDDGLYWTGITVPDSVIWPEERTSWTTAAVLLAADALYGCTRGCLVFCPQAPAGALASGEPARKISAA